MRAHGWTQMEARKEESAKHSMQIGSLTTQERKRHQVQSKDEHDGTTGVSKSIALTF